GRCLEKDAVKRLSAAEVVEALERLLSEGQRRVGVEQSPFRGLFPFAERHAGFFFGRDSEIALFLESMREQAVLPVVGPSGAGKSSFVQAGVMPRLREQGAWTMLTVRPGADPFGMLATRLAVGQSSRRTSESIASMVRTSDLGSHVFAAEYASAGQGAERTPAPISADLEGALAKQLSQSPELLGVLLHELAGDERCKVLLFVDQLEEVFTMVADRATQEAFLRAVCAVADHPSSPVRAVFTIRDDFLGYLEGGPEVATALAKVFVLRRPGNEALEEVLTRPLATVGYSYDDAALVPEMVQSVKSEPACLPLLQFAGQMLWDRRDKNRRLLCRTTYEAIGGVAGSLAEHADGVLAGMTAAQVELVRQLFLRLVTSVGTRRVLSVGVAVAGLGPGVEEVLEKLVQARLLTVRRAAENRQARAVVRRDGSRPRNGGSGGSGGGGGGGSASGSSSEAVLELVHESLVRTWARLARWLEESHDELAVLAEINQAAELWEKRGRRDEEVWQGDALADARRKLARLSTKMPEQVALFLQAGLRKEQGRRQRKRAAAAAAMALLGTAAVVSLLVAQRMNEQRRTADEQRRRAESERARAEEREAEAQREGASAALGRGGLVEARARLRSSLETQDSPLGRALWWKLGRDSLEWKVSLGNAGYDVAYAPDGRTVAAASHDGLVYLIDADTADVRLLRGETDSVTSVAFSADGRYLVSGHMDGKVVVWDFVAGAPRVLTGHRDAVLRVAVSPDGSRLASASLDKTARIWSFPAGESERVLQAAEKVGTVAFSPDGGLLATGGGDMVIRLLDVRSGTEVRRISGHQGGIVDIAFSPDGTTLASSSQDRSVRRWSVLSGEQLGVMTGHTSVSQLLAFSPDGTILASASGDKTVRLWNVARSEAIRALVGHGDYARGVAFSPDGARVASSSYDASVRLWRLFDSDRATAGDGPPSAGGQATGAVGSTTDAGQTSVDGRRSWQTQGGRYASGQGQGHGQGQDQGHRLAATGVGFDAGGRQLVTAGYDQTLRLWNVESGTEERLFLGHRGAVETVALSPDGRLLASGGSDQAVHVWEVSSGRLLRSLPGHTNIIRSVAFSASGSTLASCSADRTIRFWDAATLAEQGELVGHSNEVLGISFSPDGRQLASASYDGTVRAWEMASRRTIGTFVGGGKLQAVTFSPDGRRLYANGHDGAVRRWEIDSGAQRVLLEQSRPLGGYLSIDPSGRRLAVPAENQLLIVDAESGAAGVLGRGLGNFSRTAFHRDGRLLAATSSDGTVRLWALERAVPYWRAPVLLRAPTRLFTHRGWVVLDTPDSAVPPPALHARWEQAVAERGVFGITDAGDAGDAGEAREAGEAGDAGGVGASVAQGRRLCLQVTGEQIEEWTDTLVQRAEVPGITGLVAIPDGCVSLAGGEVRIHRNGQATSLGLTDATALVGHDGELLIAAGRRLLVVDSSSSSTKASHAVDAGVSAVGRVAGSLALGYRQGHVELMSTVEAGAHRRSSFSFKGTPSCAVTRLLAGPAGTLVGGFANGAVILWNLADGAVLEEAKLHGPIRHLLFAGSKLVAASEVGQFLLWDLGALQQSYCELMRQVWRTVPVVWESGLPVSKRSSPDHPCANDR
ncbi:MAG: hypothetical protein V2A73_11750, partial [Pseudomonadota bacterium]